MFSITGYGLSCLSIMQTSSSSCLLGKFYQFAKTDDDLANSVSLTEFDMILLLSRKGWDYEFCRTASRKTQPYVIDGEKKWYYHTNTAKGGINKKYLNTLLCSEILFEKGLKQIFHFQLAKYYVALQSLPASHLNNVLPYQPKSYYDLLIQQHCPGKHGRQKQHQKKPASFDHCEDEPGP